MPPSDCPFCSLPDSRLIKENDFFIVVKDLFPVTELHLLIISKQHIASYFDLAMEAKSSLLTLLDERRDWLKEQDSSITGFNVGVNDGEVAGQTLMHCHIHLIPRRQGDNPNPRGGVRGVIPSKQSY